MKPTLFLCLNLLLATHALADGGMDTGGGNLPEIREARIRSVIAQLPQALTAALGDRNWVQSLPHSERVLRLLDDGLLEDIQLSRYQLNQACFDSQGVETAASARIGRRGGHICFNLPMLVRMGGTERELISLAIHEHSHQMGERSEAEAMANGESLSAVLASRLVIVPPTGTPPLPSVPSDSPDGQGCLNLHRAIARFRSMPAQTPVWIAQVDRDLPSRGQSAWYRHYWTRPRSFAPPWQTRMENSFGGEIPYQVDCTKFILWTTDATGSIPTEYTITESSPFHLKARTQQTDAMIQSMEIRMPEGTFGNRMFMTQERFESLRLVCEGSTQVEYGTRMDTIRIEVDSVLPESVPISVRMLRLMAQSGDTSSVPNGCYIGY